MRNSIKFHRLRRATGYVKLGEIAGLGNTNAIRRLEQGKTKNIFADTALKIALALNVPFDQLFTLDPQTIVEITQRRDAYTPGKRKRKRYEKPKPPKSDILDTSEPVGVPTPTESPKEDLTP